MSIDRDGDGPPLRRQESKPGLAAGERNSDLRATAFTEDVFDDDYYGRRKRSGGGSRSLSMVIGVALGVAIAGGAGWFLMRAGSLTGGADESGLIKAEPTPYKVKPDDPGGLQVENQDKLVYDRVAKGDAPARVENLLPPAEEPKAPPPKKVEAPVEAPPAPKVEAPKVETPVAEAPKAEPVKEAPKEEPKAADAQPAAPAEPAADPLAAAVAAAAPGRTAATGPISILPREATTPNDAPKPESEAQTAAAPVAAAAVPAGTYQIQLASVLSEDAAMAEWKRISGKNKDILGAYQAAVTRADLGERGVFYRLRAGPLADKAAADALCASLQAQKVGCIVVKP